MAASSIAVTVLTPNGRRQTVNVSSSTPLLQVLEDVCKKHGFNPDEYDLKFQRSVLDLSLQWRFASVPNNAKLEMVPGSHRRSGSRESTVRIALQLEDGSRLQDSFSCGQTLWELVNHFPQTRVPEIQSSESTPLCVYMRDEISGEEALKKATLKSLGLTGGSAIVRYVLKPSKSPTDEESMETAAMTTATVASEEKGQEPQTTAPETTTWPAGASYQTGLDRSSERSPVTDTSSPQSTNAEPRLGKEQPGGSREDQMVVRPKNNPNWSQEAPEEQPGPSRECSTRSGTSALASTSAYTSVSQATSFVPFSGGGQRLGGPLGGDAGAVGNTPASSSSSVVCLAPPKAKKAKPSSEAKRPAIAKPQGQDDDVRQAEEFLEAVNREPLIYHMDAVARRDPGDEDLPDEFFEVTVDDIRKRFAQLKSERKHLEEAPLMTQALRESQMKQKMMRYPKVVVRVQFPDRLVLQGFFRPLETVGALMQFVKNHLADSQLPFYLFIAPPKVNLDDHTATLFQANLFPAALVYFGYDVKADCYLKSQLVRSCVSALRADEAIAGCMPRSPTPSSTSLLSEEFFPPPADSNAPTNGESTAAEETQTSSQAPKPVRTDPSKVPKWLKLPGKK